jgi:hypothetical protein
LPHIRPWFAPDSLEDGMQNTSSFFPSMNHLDLADCGIDGEFAAIFFPTLLSEERKLILRHSGNPIGDEGFRFVFNGHAHLEKVYLWLVV